MWWIPLATAAVSAYLGHKQQQEQERARSDQSMINMYAPLFGQAPQALGQRQNYTVPGAISGLLTGMDIMNQLEKKDKIAAPEASASASNDNTDVFIPYAQSPNMSAGAPDLGPYSYRPRNQLNPWGQS